MKINNIEHHYFTRGGIMTRNATQFLTLLVAFVLWGASSAFAGANLSYNVNNGTYSEISGGTVLATSTGVNSLLSGVTIPFNFNWDGTTRTTAYVSGKGFVSFTASPSGTPPSLPVGTEGIAAWYNNLTGTTTGEVSYTTTGSAPNRVFIVQWKNVTRQPQGSSNDVYNFQIHLNENSGLANVMYGSMSVSAAVGAQIGAASVSSPSLALITNYWTNNWSNPAASFAGGESMALAGWAPSSGLTYTFGGARSGDASILGVASPNGKFAENTTQTIQVRVKNWGTSRIDSVEVRWSINGSARTPVRFYPQPSGTGLPAGAEATITLGTASFGAGSLNSIEVWTVNPNAGDLASGNDKYVGYLAPRVSGVLNVAMGGNPGVFSSFRNLFRHLVNSGISGNTDVRVFNGSYDEQVLIPAVNASPSNARITIMNSNGATPRFVWTPSNNPFTVFGSYESDNRQLTVMDGASVTLRGLTFDLPEGLNWGGHIYGPFASNVNVDRCAFNGPSNFLTVPSPTFAITLFNGTFTATDNTINNMRRGINLESFSSTMLIQNNTITNCADYGILAYSGNMTVHGNKITGAAGPQFFTGIWAQGAGRLSNNICAGDVSVTAGSQSIGMQLQSMNGFGANAFAVYNNMLSCGASAGTFGIYLTNSSSFARSKVYHNTVNITGTATVNSVGYWSGGTTEAEVINNIFHNLGTGSNGGYAVFVATGSNATYTVADFNNLMTTGATVGAYNGFAYARNLTGNPLTNWRVATGKDLNSSSTAVSFVGGADLHLMTIQPLLWGSSSVTSSVPMDIDGETRTKPYMGADEVKPGIRILQQPQSRYSCLGESVTMICVAEVTEGATITYQWYKDGVELSGQTGAILTFGSIGYGASGVYTCMVKANDGTNFVQVWSDPATLIVVRQTSITVQPLSQPIVVGGTVDLEVSAEAIGAPDDFVPQYQWKKRYWSTNSNAYVDTNVVDNGRITGSQSSRLTIRDVNESDTMDVYLCQVSGYCGTAISKIARLFIPVVAASNNTPVACEAGTIQIECAVIPSVIPGSTLSYQWYFNGARLFDGGDVSGATSKVLTILNATAADAGTYHCVATYDGVNVSIPSNDVNVTISMPPSITGQPTGATLCVGDALTLTVQGGGAGVLYKWMKGTTDIPNANGATYTVAAVTEADAGTYSVRVYNACGTVTSENADVVVNVGPEITTDPSDVALTEGDQMTMTVAATGSDPLTYQWYKDGVMIAGATSATYTVASVTGADIGAYTCVVTNGCGADTSGAANASVIIGVSGDDIIADGYMLGTATPNPTQDAVSFTYTVPSAQNVTVVLTNILGVHVATVLNGTVENGTHTLRLNAQDLNLAPGVYNYTIVANGFTATQQFIVVR